MLRDKPIVWLPPLPRCRAVSPLGPLLLALLLLGSGGCGVERTMTINSDPSGALVYLNGQEVGRTPLTRDFTWYGNYDVQVRKEGYVTLKTATPVKPPLWQVPPIDLLAELMPFRLKDQQYLHYILDPASTQPAATGPILERAQELGGKLESGKYTRLPPTTAPATREAVTR